MKETIYGPKPNKTMIQIKIEKKKSHQVPKFLPLKSKT